MTSYLQRNFSLLISEECLMHEKYTSRVFANFTSLERRIALQVAKKLHRVTWALQSQHLLQEQQQKICN